MPNYIALIRKDPDSIYGVDFPDFPGCISAGESLEEAKQMAQEALEMHIEGMLEDGDEIPQPSSLETVMSDPENKDAVAFLVFVRSKKTRAKRINITFPEDILEEVDLYIKDHKPRSNRSKFLVQSAREALGKRKTAVLNKKGGGKSRGVFNLKKTTKSRSRKRKSKATA